MFKIVKPHEIKLNKNYIAMIYGRPGVGKTTLACSAKKPIILDFDRGISRIENPAFRVDALDIDQYDDVIDFIQSFEIDNYDTIIIDTVGACVDCMAAFVMRQNPRVCSNGSLTLRGYGELKAVILNFFRLIKSKNKKLIFVAHEREETDDDIKILRPHLGSGKGGQELICFADIIGYLEHNQGETYFTLRPFDNKTLGKNSFGLPAKIKVPNPNEIGHNDWFQVVIDEFLAQKEVKDNAVRSIYDEISDQILNIKDEISCNEIYKKIVENPKYKNIIGWKKNFKSKMDDLGLEFNKSTERFEYVCHNA